MEPSDFLISKSLEPSAGAFTVTERLAFSSDLHTSLRATVRQLAVLASAAVGQQRREAPKRTTLDGVPLSMVTASGIEPVTVTFSSSPTIIGVVISHAAQQPL
jgi:hypothetical protein